MFTINQGMPDQGWDERLAGLGGHFLQSRAWSEFQSALKRELLWSNGQDWAWVGNRRQSRGVSYLTVPYGPTVSGVLDEALESLKQGGQQARADFVRIEPMSKTGAKELSQAGLASFGDVNPTHTWKLNLAPDEAILRSNLSSGNRNIVNRAERDGTSFRLAKAGEVQPFLSLLHQTYDRAGIKAYDDSYYQKMLEILAPSGAAKLFYAETEGQIAAGAIVYDFNGVRHYAHAAADQALNRRSNAARVLVWQMIMDAKRHGFSLFDFWGVAPNDDPKHPWHGLSQFKKSFGGEAVEYVGTWDLPLKKTKYQAYRLAKKVLG